MAGSASNRRVNSSISAVSLEHPQLVRHVVVGRDGDVGIALGCALEQGVDLGRVRIAHHHRPGLRIERLDLLDAVGLLHRRGELVLAHPVGRVVGERGDAGQAGLPAAGPRRAIGVVVGVGVADEDALGDHALEVLGRRGVDRGRIRVGARRQVDLGLGDVQEAPRLAPGPLARLRAREHVVGRRDDLARAGGHRAQGTEGTDERHAPLLLLLGSCPRLVAAGGRCNAPVAVCDDAKGVECRFGSRHEGECPAACGSAPTGRKMAPVSCRSSL